MENKLHGYIRTSKLIFPTASLSNRKWSLALASWSPAFPQGWPPGRDGIQLGLIQEISWNPAGR